MPEASRRDGEQGAARSLAERLGFEAQDRVAVVHIDDIGMCHAVNHGAFEALRNGPATCGSLMVPCPWFREAVEIARAEPGLDLGIHLTLNAEFEHYRWGPVAGRSAVPSLLDDEGYLPRSSAELVARARPEEVETELRAQIDMALAAGVDVTHLDAHMGTIFFPPLQTIYARLARDYRLPVFAARPDEQVLAELGLAQAAPLLRELCDEVERAGIPLLDGFDLDSLGFAEGEGAQHNASRLARLPVGVSYLICHPARAGEELSRVAPEQAHQRAFELSFYGGTAGHEALAEQGIHTVGMRAIRDLMR